MILITGGAWQGKTTYAKERFGLTKTDLFDCSGLKNTGDSPLEPVRDVRCILHLESFAYSCVCKGLEPAEELAGMFGDLKEKILICDDISCGIVPVDPIVRAYREAVGRMLNRLSREADEVVRLFCGIPQKLK